MSDIDLNIIDDGDINLIYYDDGTVNVSINDSSDINITFGDTFSTFSLLTDTPASFYGEVGNFPQVNTGATALEYTDAVMGKIVHGSTSGIVRPTGFGVVTWIGDVEPTNALNNDVWIDTT